MLSLFLMYNTKVLSEKSCPLLQMYLSCIGRSKL